MNKSLSVISIGGSLVNPGEINSDFIKSITSIVTERTKKGQRFILVIGGGKPARQYQDALKNAKKPTAQELDWMGIFATRLNAEFVRLTLGKLAHGKIVTDPSVKLAFKEKVLVSGGWKPGWSTDYVAVMLAKQYGADRVLNLSNIDYAYTKDPTKFKDAVKLEQTTWKEFKKVVGTKWVPGANAPFDPIATRLAESNKLKVIIANGKNIKNLKNILDGKGFVGTTIT